MVPAVTVAGPVLTTARSAAVATVAVTVELLLAALVSVVVVVAVAVLLMVEPSASLASALTMMTKVARSPAVMDAAVRVIVPVPPAGGVVGVNNVAPPVCVSDTNVVPAGTASVKDTAWASLGPLLVRVTV